jgi:Ferric reductase like transmembrane component/Class III cytochrome C family
LLGGACLAAIVLLPATVRRDGLAWELVQLAGYLSAIGCLFLTGAALRPRDARPSRLLTLDQHKWLAWITLALLGTHVGGTLIVDRHTIEYLKLSTPIYQLAGILAALALVIASISALGRVRRFLWQNASLFRAVHVLLAALIVILVFVHVVATDRYASGPRRWLWTAMTVLVLLLPLQRVSQTARPSPWPLAFSVYARRVFLALALVALACVGFAAQTRERRAQVTLETVAERAQALPVEFPHEQHGTVNCLTCHHNFVDHTGVDNCIPCHRSTRSDIRLDAEARFHSFCMHCHRDGELVATGLRKHGPVSQCSACHRPSTPWRTLNPDVGSTLELQRSRALEVIDTGQGRQSRGLCSRVSTDPTDRVHRD